MPERKGRRRRGRDRRRETRTEGAASAAPPAPPAERAAPPRRRATADPDAIQLPSSTARYTGFMIAAITAFVSILMIADAINGDHSTIDATVRIIAGSMLILLSVAVAALVLVPRWLAGVLARRRSRAAP